MTNKLMLRNDIQKALFIFEIQGQLSDGFWENSRPHDHWKDWCALVENDVVIGDQLGRNFNPIRSNYTINSKTLFEYVGERMLNIARFTKYFSYSIAGKLHECFGLLNQKEWYGIPEYFDADTKDLIEHIGEKLALSVANDDSIYSKKDLARDLKDIRVAMATYREF